MAGSCPTSTFQDIIEIETIVFLFGLNEHLTNFHDQKHLPNLLTPLPPFPNPPKKRRERLGVKMLN
jgi:hypothetical protein